MIHIITGSTLGGAEYVGDHLSDLLEQAGHETTIHNQPEVSAIPSEGTWLIVTSTHGAGDYPDNIKPFFAAIQTAPPRMSNVRFAVVALGDSSYDTFCEAGKQARELLLDIGTSEICEPCEIDVLSTPVPEDAAEVWLKEVIESF
ncbi:FMN-binding protein MioC [Vibrio tapetis subsp. quintayensis]|uniref:FMN-binding protein MioC n=1 Tax=Vibrio tapetis TaxID=52443 RepID=UPI0025B417C5|nr:FMN-binding protein MioC [Vibrio tapetis]MDN3679351.1 FMN-binding protein MioC [Vibrio tapetis subsp. quintayensis]